MDGVGGQVPQDRTVTSVITSTDAKANRFRPNSATAGGSQFLLTVDGNDFRHDSLVSWNGSFSGDKLRQQPPIGRCHYRDRHRTAGNGAGLCVQSSGRRYHFCRRCDGCEIHHLL
jgi:hypothetical protein